MFCNKVASPYLCQLMNRINWDTLGITASVACAIHCAVLPLFLSSLPLFGINIINNTIFEGGMILLAFAIGSYALWHGYKQHHHRLVPLFIFSFGFIFLVLKEFFIVYESWLLLPAVLMIVSAHFLNYRLCRKANNCHAEDCAH